MTRQAQTTLEHWKNKVRVAGEAIGAIETAQRRADNSKKVGQFYKTRNEKPSDYWLYSKVTRMDKDGFLYTMNFQVDSRGNVSVRFDHFAHHMAGHIKIGKQEFGRAWAKAQAKLAKVSDGI